MVVPPTTLKDELKVILPSNILHNINASINE